MSLWLILLLETSHLAIARFGVRCVLGFLPVLSGSVFASSAGRRAAGFEELEAPAIGLTRSPDQRSSRAYAEGWSQWFSYPARKSP